MIKDLIMSGQNENYLLLSELFKNLTPKEIFDEFINVAEFLIKYCIDNNIKGETEFEYYRKFDQPDLFEVYTANFNGDHMYYIGNNNHIYITNKSVEVYTNVEYEFTSPTEEFKEIIINVLSDL